MHFVHIKGIAGDTEPDPFGLDFKAIEAQFMEENRGLLFSRQSLRFKYASVKLSECSECSAAFSRALRTYTSRIHLESYGLFLDEYLDSKELHQFLTEFGEELADEGGLKRPEGPARVIPVYVWDLDAERQLLLDRFHQVSNLITWHASLNRWGILSFIWFHTIGHLNLHKFQGSRLLFRV